MSVANELVGQFSRIVRPDGGVLVVVTESEKTVRLGYTAGTGPSCDSGLCSLPAGELQTMMQEWLARRAPGTTVEILPVRADLGKDR